MNYQELGFKSGLEIHCQLDTQRKLFCHCPTEKTEEFPITVKRKLRAVSGELGQVDTAAREETRKQMTFIYKAHPKTSCLVEFDAEPPHPMNSEALNVALQLGKLFNSSIIDEVHVMRKTVVDGSNTSGFQRTALVCTGGQVNTSKGEVGITNIQVEEDAATPIEKKENQITYRLDRLGVPLIELGTSPDIKSPEHLKETALRIGALLKATGKTKRGIGTIRQDLNISIKGGTRVEIKGAQEPSMFPEIAKREVQRQLALIEVKKQLEHASVGEPLEVTELFKESECNFVRKAEEVVALPLKGFSGILGKEVQPGRRVGTELSDYAKAVGVGGLIHSDEDLGKYRLKDTKLREKLGLEKKDAFILVASKKNLARRAVEVARARALVLLEGVPPEVRKVVGEGNSAYMRPMPGAARLYPETDCPPILITEELVDAVEIPERPEVTEKKLLEKGLSKDLAEKLVGSQNLVLFKKINSKNPSLVASTLEDTLTALRRDGFAVDEIKDHHFIKLFELYDQGAFAKESIPSIIEALTLNPGKSVEGVVKELGFGRLSEDQVREEIRKVLEQNKEVVGQRNAFSIIMGEVMKKLRGKADGGLIARITREEMKA